VRAQCRRHEPIPPGGVAGPPEVGFQVDFPTSLPAPIPQGCSAPTRASDTAVTCLPVLPGATLSLEPGVCHDVMVAPGGTLVFLDKGDYLFDNLWLELGAQVNVPAGRNVRILTKQSAAIAADVKCFDASGVADCDPEESIVAPNASIVVAPLYGRPTYGTFWSNQSVLVMPWAKITVPRGNVFLDPNDLPAYKACGGAAGDAGAPDGGAD
jgi:hypothetical protein